MTNDRATDRSADSRRQGRSKLRIPRWAYWACGVVVVIVAFWVATRSGEDTFGAAVTTAKVTRGPMEVTITGPGRIRAANAVDIEVPRNIRGNLQLIYLITEGTVVEAGQVVARLDTTAAVQRLENALDQLGTTEASYEQLLVDHRNSILNLENSVRSAELSYAQAELQLRNLEFSSELEQEQGRLNLENARISRDESSRKLEAQKIINEAERQQREINLEGQREEVEETRRELEALTIRAPISGLVIYAEQGRWSERTKTREGDTVNRSQELVRLPDLSVLLVEVRVNELDAKRVRIGQRARVRLEAYPRLQLPGHVSDVSTLAQETSFGGNVRVFPAVITLDEPDPRARPGMTASADIIVDELDDVLCLPLSAVGIINQRTFVKIVDSQEPVEVELGLRNESEAQVLGGLVEGDQVELGWLQEPSTVLGTLAGRNPVPEAVAQSIIAQGDEYGGASPVREFQVMQEEGQGEEMIEQVRRLRDAAGAGREVPGEMRGGMVRVGAMGDSARVSQWMSQLRQMRESLPDSLRAEVERILSGEEFDFRTLSPALMDSLRARGGGGRPRRPPQDPPPDTGTLLPTVASEQEGIRT